jgi:spore coat protein H
MRCQALLVVASIAPLCFAQDDLFQPGKVRSIELRFTSEQWRAMEPAHGRNGIAFGRGEWLQGPPGKRNGLASAMGIEFKYVHADLTIDNRSFRDVAVRFKGNGTYLQANGKYSFKIDLNEFVKGQNFGGLTKLNLHSNVTDPSWMNEPLSYRLYRDAGVPAPRTGYARVYLKIGAERRFAGLYSLVENIDSRFLERNFNDKGGALFKPVSTDLFRYLGADWAAYNQTYDPKESLTVDQKQRVIDFTRLVAQANDTEFASRLGEFIDLEEFARYMAVLVYLSDMDGILGPGQNFYLYLSPKTRKFSFIPWDQDHSFGQFPMNSSQDQRNNLSIHKPWIGRKRFLERCFAVPAFKTLYLRKLDEFSRAVFQPTRFAAQVDEIAALIRPSVQEESKLDRFDRAVAGTSRSYVPIKPFVKLRAQSIADQLAGKSQGRRID